MPFGPDKKTKRESGADKDDEVTSPSRQRRKSERARKEICDATIACLVETGYAGTSIGQVVSRTTLSKGALQHHFPTKEDLITATADYLLQRSLTRRPSERSYPEAPGDVAAVLLHTWTHLINTDAYRALLEILNAARTDEQLKARISPRLRHWNQAIDRQMVAQFCSTDAQRDKDDEEVVTLMVMNRSLMRGLVIQDRYQDDPAYSMKVVLRWIEIVAPLLKLRSTPGTKQRPS